MEPLYKKKNAMNSYKHPSTWFEMESFSEFQPLNCKLIVQQFNFRSPYPPPSFSFRSMRFLQESLTFFSRLCAPKLIFLFIYTRTVICISVIAQLKVLSTISKYHLFTRTLMELFIRFRSVCVFFLSKLYFAYLKK